MLKSFLMFYVKILVATLLLTHCQARWFNYSSTPDGTSKRHQNYLSSIQPEEWRQFLQMGSDTVNKRKRLEENLQIAEITVEQGSLSHAQLLDTLPNLKANEDNDIATKILQSSLFIYNTKCVDNGISGPDCQTYLADKEIPATSELQEECTQLLQSRHGGGHYPFRRLLPRNYKDGFFKMYSEDILPAPHLVSSNALYDRKSSLDKWDGNSPSLSLVQWTQFIEHDLSKPVVNSMINGNHIECCNKDNYKLQPRFEHPACAPILVRDPSSKYGRETCLNYVRSALVVGSKCTFGSLEQLNQATGYLDLSQLYGFTEMSEKHMRSYKQGQIKSTHAAQLNQELLPIVNVKSHAYCALKLRANDSTCFMAGDSRVNSNPLSIAIYTIFMRNHNQIASKLKSQHPYWNDERLFQTAKATNVDIYRRIVFDEWLPIVLGDVTAGNINKAPLTTRIEDHNAFQISNEFAVAAIRFYFSMMPNELSGIAKNNIFEFKDQIYKPILMYSSNKLNEIFESLLQQRAMDMDASYVKSLLLENMNNSRPMHADILAFDIQRGRDHGLQGYVKYMEVCRNVKVNSWRDLENVIALEDINALKSVYNNWSDIDLIVGGISEIPVNGSTVGSTFSCILAEQFDKIRQWQHELNSKTDDTSNLLEYKNITAADVICANSELKYVPKNIFLLESEKNPLISCADYRVEQL